MAPNPAALDAVGRDAACHEAKTVDRVAGLAGWRRRLAASSGDHDAQVSQQLATAFERFLVGLLQQIIPKMKLFIRGAGVPEIAVGDAWFGSVTLPGDATTQGIDAAGRQHKRLRTLD